MESMALSHYTEVHSKSSTFNACSLILSYFFIASSLMNNTRRLFSTGHESWRES